VKRKQTPERRYYKDSDDRTSDGWEKFKDQGMSAAEAITVEFFGTPRQRAGRSEIIVTAGTMAEVLAAIEKACPMLAGLLDHQGHVATHYLLSLNGDRFVSDLKHTVKAGDRLLVLSADAGG
jgi:molybdopterin converting factor small subunit